MDRREALKVFGVVAATRWGLDKDGEVTKQELKELIRDFDVNYPYSVSAVSDLPGHVHKMNLILKAVAEAVL